MGYIAHQAGIRGDSPGKNTGVICHVLHQGIFPTQGSNPGLLHCRWILYQLSYQGSPYFPDILTAYLNRKWNLICWLRYTFFYLHVIRFLFSFFLFLFFILSSLFFLSPPSFPSFLLVFLHINDVLYSRWKHVSSLPQWLGSSVLDLDCLHVNPWTSVLTAFSFLVCKLGILIVSNS